MAANVIFVIREVNKNKIWLELNAVAHRTTTTATNDMNNSQAKIKRQLAAS